MGTRKSGRLLCYTYIHIWKAIIELYIFQLWILQDITEIFVILKIKSSSMLIGTIQLIITTYATKLHQLELLIKFLENIRLISLSIYIMVAHRLVGIGEQRSGLRTLILNNIIFTGISATCSNYMPDIINN